MELGQHLVRELGQLENTDTLASWMAHHLAELLQDVKSAKTPAKRRTAETAAVDTILKIWDHREKLPGEAYPLARYRDILDILHRMNGSTPPWSRRGGSRAGQVIEALPRDYSTMLLGALLLQGNLHADATYDELVESFLGPPESELFGGIRIVVRDFAAEDEKAAAAEVPVADRIRSKTIELIDRVASELKTLRESITGDDKKARPDDEPAI